MKTLATPVMALLCVINAGYITGAAECGPEAHSPDDIRISIFSKRNRTGKWITEYRAQKDDSDTERGNELALDLSHRVTECGGRRILTLRAKIFDDGHRMEYPAETDLGEMRFHPKVGINVAVTNNGRSVEKIILAETAHGLAFTNRPLKDDELFEVTLDRKSNHFKNSLGLGASPYHPENVTMEKHITDLKPPSWSMYYADLYYNKDVVKRNYGRSLDTVVVGDRVGIMRRSSGSLHYFINGADLGAAATGVPSNIYGVIELYANAAGATIVQRS